MWLIITLLIGIIGALIAIKLKVPAGAIIGSLISVVIFSIFTGKAQFPQGFKMIVQICTGTYIGSHIRRKDLVDFKQLIKPALILTISLCSFSIIGSVLLNRFNGIDLATALFATAPAGITDMTIISIDFGADSSKVAALQFIRLISVITIMPSLIKYFMLTTDRVVIPDNNKKLTKDSNADKDYKEILNKTVKTMFIGGSFGYIGYLIGVPAGAISFAMIASAVYNIKTSKAYMSIKIRKSVQVLGGVLIGSRMTMDQIMGMKEILPMIIVIVLGYTGLNFVLAHILTKYSNLNLLTALYSSAAGGLTDMAIIASEMGADAPKVAVLQLVRVVGIIVFYPIVIKVFLNLVT